MQPDWSLRFRLTTCLVFKPAIFFWAFLHLFFFDVYSWLYLTVITHHLHVLLPLAWDLSNSVFQPKYPQLGPYSSIPNLIAVVTTFYSSQLSCLYTLSVHTLLSCPNHLLLYLYSALFYTFTLYYRPHECSNVLQIQQYNIIIFVYAHSKDCQCFG